MSRMHNALTLLYSPQKSAELVKSKHSFKIYLTHPKCFLIYCQRCQNILATASVKVNVLNPQVHEGEDKRSIYQLRCQFIG